MLYGAILLYLFLNMFPEPTSRTVYAGFNMIFAIYLSARSLFCIMDSLNRFALLSQKLPAGAYRVREFSAIENSISSSSTTHFISALFVPVSVISSLLDVILFTSNRFFRIHKHTFLIQINIHPLEFRQIFLMEHLWV